VYENDRIEITDQANRNRTTNTENKKYRREKGKERTEEKETKNSRLMNNKLTRKQTGTGRESIQTQKPRKVSDQSGSQ